MEKGLRFRNPFFVYQLSAIGKSFRQIGSIHPFLHPRKTRDGVVIFYRLMLATSQKHPFRLTGFTFSRYIAGRFSNNVSGEAPYEPGHHDVTGLPLKYSRERTQFGKPIGNFQVNAFKLADMARPEASGNRRGNLRGSTHCHLKTDRRTMTLHILQTRTRFPAPNTGNPIPGARSSKC